jgi:hypothetical protein
MLTTGFFLVSRVWSLFCVWFATSSSKENLTYDVHVPSVVEVEGQRTDMSRFRAGLFDLLIMSHKEQSLISLRFLNTTITVEAEKLQLALRSIVDTGQAAAASG